MRYHLFSHQLDLFLPIQRKHPIEDKACCGSDMSIEPANEKITARTCNLRQDAIAGMESGSPESKPAALAGFSGADRSCSYSLYLPLSLVC